MAQGARLARPEQGVFAAFADADGYQAIVRNIDAAARRRIEARLPFRVHFNEIGEHSVYVALRGRLPLGLVYLLPEEDEFGLTEVVWAVDLDMRLAGFRFQRSRSPHRQVFEECEFARLLRGRSGADLARLIDGEGKLSARAQGVPPGTEGLAAAMVRSALKALTVVDEVWVLEINKLRDLAVGIPAFPTARRFLGIWPPRQTVAPGSAAPRPAEVAGADAGASIVVAVRAFGDESRPLGVVAKVSTAAAAGVIITWIVDDAGQVMAADADATAPAPLRAACHEAIGKSLADAAKLAAQVGESASALLLLLQPAARPGR